MELVVRNEGGHTRRITDYGIEKIEQMAAEGCSEASMAKALRIAEPTFRDRKRNDPRVAEALARGRGAHHDETIGHLTQHMRNGNVTAAIFLAKSLHGYRDQGPTQDLHINVNTGVLRVPQPIPIEGGPLPVEDVEDDEPERIGIPNRPRPIMPGDRN